MEEMEITKYGGLSDVRYYSPQVLSLKKNKSRSKVKAVGVSVPKLA